MKKFIRSIAAALLLSLVLTFFGLPRAMAAGEPGLYDPAAEGILTDYYHIDRDLGYLVGIAPGTTAQVLAQRCVPGDLEASRDVIGTGTLLTSAQTAHSLTAIVAGDLNGDANITITDLLMLKTHILGTLLTGASLAAGDVNQDGNVSITDFLKIKSHLLALEEIRGAKPAVAATEPMILAKDGSQSWPQEAAAYRSADETLVSVDASGTITACGKEGSAFVYALDSSGNVLRRQLVTVLQDGIRISFAADTQKLIPGQSLTLHPMLNHPVAPTVAWLSSDPATVSVDNGVLTAHAMGEATVTATLPNGASAQVAVSVIPGITDLTLEKSLYKIKPGATRQLVCTQTPADTGEELVWESSDTAIATVDGTGTVTGITYGTVTITVRGKYSGLSTQCQVKVCDVKQVAITFDDGPSAYTPKLLDFLAEKDIKVTFFLVCSRLNSYKSTVIREVNEGHEIAYHSYDHSNQKGLSSARIVSDYEKSAKLLKDLTGAEFTLWRTPGGNYDQRVLNCVPLPHILWSVDTRDWETRNADKVYRAIINNARDGSIILLHDLHSTTVDGSIRAMAEMLEGDYEFLTVTELLSRKGTPPKNSATYYSG